MKEDLAPRSLSMIKSVVSWLVEENHLPAPSRLTIQLEKPRGAQTFCYTNEQAEAMMQICRDRADLHWLEVVIAALACTGMRVAELAELRWGDIDLDAGTIRVTDDAARRRRRTLETTRRTKRRRDRTLPISKDLAEILLGLTRRPDGRVFYGPLGEALQLDTIRSVFLHEVIKPLLKRFPTPDGEVGLEHATLHSFRHFLAS
jgi:integrase